MTEKQLMAKLNSMKNVNLDAAWLKGHRDVLYTQIENTGASDLSAWEKLLCEVKALTTTASRPVVSLASFLLLIAVFGVFSHKLFTNAKPNDSLYIARVISEKAKVNMTFNSENRTKLEAKFAASHAQDIAAALADQSVSSDPEKTKDLNEKFDKEIKTVKESLAKVTPASAVSIAAKVEGQGSSAEVQSSLEEEGVFAADSRKDENGIKISGDGNGDGNGNNPNQGKAEEQVATQATTTIEIETEVASSSAATNVDAADEVRLYFDQKDYNSAIDKLKQIEESIELE